MTRPPTAEPPPIEHIRAEVRRALGEDLGGGDVTATLIDPTTTGSASIVCREPAVICGVPWVEEVFRQMDANIGLVWHTRDGDRVPADTTLCRLQGPARALVTGERTALNFLQLLSGVATTAQRYADAVAGTATRILDTRKTLPGLRRSQKYAVRCGGCLNHRMGLYDAVLIKENHIVAAGSITAAVASIRTRHPELPVEVEAETFAELDEALAAGADIVMLDNFTLADLHQAVTRTAGRARLEVSGNVGLAALAEIAATGVDYISTGALTKHVQAIDLSMRFDPPAGSTDR